MNTHLSIYSSFKAEVEFHRVGDEKPTRWISIRIEQGNHTMGSISANISFFNMASLRILHSQIGAAIDEHDKIPLSEVEIKELECEAARDKVAEEIW